MNLVYNKLHEFDYVAEFPHRYPSPVQGSDNRRTVRSTKYSVAPSPSDPRRDTSKRNSLVSTHTKNVQMPPRVQPAPKCMGDVDQYLGSVGFQY